MDCSLGLRRFLCDRIWVFPSTHTLFALLAADTALPRIQGVLHTGHLTGHTSRYLTHEGAIHFPPLTLRRHPSLSLSLSDRRISLSCSDAALSLSAHTKLTHSHARTRQLLTHRNRHSHTKTLRRCRAPHPRTLHPPAHIRGYPIPRDLPRGQLTARHYSPVAT